MADPRHITRRSAIKAGLVAAALPAVAVAEEPQELPVDRVHRLSEELAYALDDWSQQANIVFSAHVYPASSGRGMYFRNDSLDPLLASDRVPTRTGSGIAIGLLVNRYRAANAAWLATAGADGDVDAEGPEYEEAWSAVKDIITHQCQSPEEVQEKLKVVLSDQWLCETSESGRDEELGRMHRHFLRSLIV